MKPLLFAAAVSLLLVTSGCTVLTASQVKEVNSFAMAAKDYADMPGTVIAEHARIRKVRLVLGAAMDRNGDTALEAIKIALDQQKNLENRGQQAAALKVLEDGDLMVAALDTQMEKLQADRQCLDDIHSRIGKDVVQLKKVADRVDAAAKAIALVIKVAKVVA